MATKRRPEERIAADLGLTMSDLERIVRAERAKRLAPRMVAALRDLDRFSRLERARREAESILEIIDAPVSDRRSA